MSNDNKNLVPVNEGIFSKIKTFFRGIFVTKTNYSYETSDAQSTTSEIKTPVNPIFVENIKVEETNEQRLKRLQRQIRERKISEVDLQSEDIKELRDLYNEQINSLRNSILEKRNKIMKIKYEQKRKAHAVGNK